MAFYPTRSCGFSPEKSAFGSFFRILFESAFGSRSSVVPKLNPQQIKEQLAALPGWQIEGGELVKSFSFGNFVEALQFVNRVGEAAENAGHHPDIDIRYNRVRLALVTHDAGGLTEKDFQLASQVNTLA
jgi:4a-hydroxytetrahydrobiopterin dehydratase